jgi:hypothetical protein
MAPYSTAKLTMTVSQILLSNKTDGTCCQAKTDWKIANNGGTARPCQLLTPSNTAPVSITTIPTGFTTSSSTSGPIVVADVTYEDIPGFKFPALALEGLEDFQRGADAIYAPARPEFARILGNNRHEVLIAAPPAAISSDCTRRLRDFHAVFCPGRETCLAFAIPKPGFPLLLPARAYSRMPEPVPMSHPRP